MSRDFLYGYEVSSTVLMIPDFLSMVVLKVAREMIINDRENSPELMEECQQDAIECMDMLKSKTIGRIIASSTAKVLG